MCKLNVAHRFASPEQGSARLNLPTEVQVATDGSKEMDGRTIELELISKIPTRRYEMRARTNEECSRTHLCR
jgi:hypothetical protein